RQARGAGRRAEPTATAARLPFPHPLPLRRSALPPRGSRTAGGSAPPLRRLPPAIEPMRPCDARASHWLWELASSRKPKWRVRVRRGQRGNRGETVEEAMRLAAKIAIVVGAGQGPGEGLGNGRATALLFARNGAKVLAVDSNLESAKETAAIVAENGGEGGPIEADVTKEATLKAAVDEGGRGTGRRHRPA